MRRVLGLGRFFVKFQIVRFAFVGAIATVVDYGMFALFLTLLPSGLLTIWISVAAAYVSGLLVHFFLSRWLVFKPSKFEKRVEFLMVATVGTIGFALTGFITVELSRILLLRSTMTRKQSLFAAKAVATVIVFFWNFFARRHFIYRQHKPLQVETEVVG